LEVKTDKLKILFVSYDGLTDPLGQSQILPYFRELSKKGMDITILSCEKRQAFNEIHKRVERIVNEHEIKWEYFFYSNKLPLLSNFISLQQLTGRALSLHKAGAFNLVHCRSVLTLPAGLKLQKRGARLLFDIRGFWAEERVDGKLWNLKNPLYKFLYKKYLNKQQKGYQAADHIVTLTQAARKKIMKEHAIKADKISVIPCTVDLSLFKPSEGLNKQSHALRVKYDLTEYYPILCYSGSLGTRYLVNEMLQAFASIREQFKNAHLLVLTKSPTQDLKRQLEGMGLGNEVTLASSTYSEMPAYINMCDAGIYFIYKGNSGAAASPTKQAEFLALGKPIITNQGIGDTDKFIENHSIGYVLEAFTEDAYRSMAKELEKILNMPADVIRATARKEFNLEKGVKTYFKIYQQLC
jgi:glycosyltransferase involved in cell wall biosynthesis